MAASGNITEDLEAIRDLLRPGTYGFEVYEIENWVPWSPPASEEEIGAAKSRLPGLPDEVVEIFRLSANVVAGGLDFKWGLADVAAYDRQQYIDSTGFGIGFVPSDDLHTNKTIEDDNGWVPQDGDLVFFAGFAMPINGPHMGVIYTGGHLGRQRAAWRLRDVVACTRELYENGWYEHWDLTGLRDTSETYNELYGELVVPTIDLSLIHI